MSNTITLDERQVNELLPTWSGVELWHSTTQEGPFTFLAIIPYVLDQIEYSYVDSNGTVNDWYKVRRYGPGPTYDAFTPAWPVAPAGFPGITLAQIEQALAPRIGPYFKRTHSSQNHGTTTLAYFDELKTNANIGGVQNLWMLRRGELATGTTVFVPPTDRQRLASSYDSTSGAVTADRPWEVPPFDNESIEFHHLDPNLELRPAVLGGLSRCWFEDRISVTVLSQTFEINVTEAAPWVTAPDQISRIQLSYPGSPSATSGAIDIGWFKPFLQTGNVWIDLGPSLGTGTLLITAVRPVTSIVNGVDSTIGPRSDNDLLTTDLNYAASAAHIEAWRLFPARLKAAAEAGFQINQQGAALEFSRQSPVQRRNKRTNWTLNAPFAGTYLSPSAR